MVNETVGKIEYSRSAGIFARIGVIFGVACVITCIYTLAGNVNVSADGRFGCWVFIPVGLIYAFICGGMLFMKSRAFIKVTPEGISAFCQLGLSLNCTFDDVADVYYNAGKELGIELKNGKRYYLMHIANAVPVGHAILERMGAARKKYLCDREGLKAEYFEIKKNRKLFEIIGTAGLIVFLVEIILAGGYTGWKDMEFFSKNDWITFYIFAGIALVTAAVTVWSVYVCSKSERKLNRICRSIFANIFYRVPVLTEGAEYIFLDDEYAPTFRAAVYRKTEGDGAYFVLEEIDENFQLVALDEPVEYASMVDLLTDIKDWFELKKYRFDKNEGFENSDE